MVALEPSGELLSFCSPCFASSFIAARNADLRMLILWQRHVAELGAAALDGVTLAEHLLDRLPERFRAIDHEQPPPARVQGLDQMERAGT